jgi:fucose 4-O-acetylase-like acetyltransferase
MERERLKYFDLVSGLFMIQIIIMHILQFSENFATSSVFSFIMHVSFFFMPWFYFKSGYLYSTPKNGSKLYFKSKAKSLLLPFVLFTVIGFVLYFPFEVMESKRSIARILLSPGFAMIRWGNGGVGNQPIWFLLSLFLALSGFFLLDKFKLKLLIVLFPFAGYALYYFDYNLPLPLGLSNVFLGIFFLYAGYIFKKYIEKSKYVKPILWFSLIIYCVIQILWFSSLDMRINTVTSGNYFVYLLSALCGLVLIYFIGKKIDYIKPINYIGENSMVYFVAHWPILFLVKNAMDMMDLKTTGYVFASILTVVGVVVLPLCVSALNGKFKFLIGK